MLKSVLKGTLGLGAAVVEGARIEGDSIIVSARMTYSFFRTFENRIAA